MNEHDGEPVHGLPGRLPPGERILWQGAPNLRVLARSALRSGWIGGYFAVLIALGLWSGDARGAAITALAAAACLALVYLYAWATARTAVYTLTNRRVVMRIGVAVSISYNLPLAQVTSASVRPLAGGHGDLALGLPEARIGYLMLWPHARPWRMRSPEPTLRAIPEAAAVAELLAEARGAARPATDGAPSLRLATAEGLQVAA